MYARLTVIGLLLLLFLQGAAADTLQVAQKGKKQKITPRHGKLSSFDGTTLIFEETARSVKYGHMDVGIAPYPQTISTQVPVKNVVITITLTPRDSQEPVDPYRPYAYYKVPGGIEELDKAEIPEEIDLTHCSGRGMDRVVETNPQVSFAWKPPVSGKIESINDGTVILKRKSDGATAKYQLDSLSEIVIGFCQ